jgi:hypothetical protein
VLDLGEARKILGPKIYVRDDELVQLLRQMEVVAQLALDILTLETSNRGK